MKKLLTLSAFLFALTSNAAIQADLDKGLDLTALTTVTASQLNQLVANATAATNKGMVIWQNTEPDTTNNVRYKRFVWLDSSTSPPTMKVYNTNLNAWAAQTLAANSVTSNNIVANAINNSKITDATIAGVKLADNAVTDVKISAGAVTTSKIAASAVVSNSIAANAIYGPHIYTNAILGYHITAGVITGDKLAALTITNDRIALGTITSNQIFGGTIVGTNIASGGVVLTNISTIGASSGQVLTYTGSAVAYQTPVIVTNFTSSQAIPALDTAINFAHGLGQLPKSVYVVLVCTSADLNYSVNDEIPLWSVFSNNNNFTPGIIINSDATNVRATIPSGLNAANAVRVVNKTVFTLATIDTTKWQIKVYAFR